MSSVLSSASSAQDGGGEGKYGVMGTYKYIVVTSTMVTGVPTRFVNLLGKSLHSLTSGMTCVGDNISITMLSARLVQQNTRSPDVQRVNEEVLLWIQWDTYRLEKVCLEESYACYWPVSTKSEGTV